jgi:cellulose synthase/poly-beta-1,6-N-acetylglucosamine synthase-like glycosyltransferase
MTLLTIAHLLFWSAALVFFYVYIGYPLLVYLVSRIWPKRLDRELFEPTVSFIITAYNEELDLRAKLENTLSLDYPADKLEIIVASDCSTDKTDEIAGEFASRGVRLVRQEERKGKTSAQNLAVEHANGEIILFSDATTIYRKDVLRAMMPNFADREVGCVAGKLIYVDELETGVGKGARSYWNYETFLKESESRACSLIGVSGCLYSVRKSAYQPLPLNSCSDFLIATVIYQQGLRTVYEPAAVCTEETNRQSEKEMRMRVRVIAQTFTDLWRIRGMLNPFRSGFFAVELISHKVLRYSIPVVLMLLLTASALGAGQSAFFFALLVLQLAFYAAALLAWVLEKKHIKSGVLAIPLYFVLTSLAALIGFYKFLRGEHFTRWEPIRENELNMSPSEAALRRKL